MITTRPSRMGTTRAAKDPKKVPEQYENSNTDKAQKKLRDGKKPKAGEKK